MLIHGVQNMLGNVTELEKMGFSQKLLYNSMKKGLPGSCKGSVPLPSSPAAAVPPRKTHLIHISQGTAGLVNGGTLVLAR